MALSYEENQGPLHNLLAQVFWDISNDINGTSVMLRGGVGGGGGTTPIAPGTCFVYL